MLGWAHGTLRLPPSERASLAQALRLGRPANENLSPSGCFLPSVSSKATGDLMPAGSAEVMTISISANIQRHQGEFHVPQITNEDLVLEAIGENCVRGIPFLRARRQISIGCFGESHCASRSRPGRGKRCGSAAKCPLIHRFRQATDRLLPRSQATFWMTRYCRTPPYLP